MNYGAILKRGWTITWSYRALWLFGFLAALFGGMGWPNAPQSGNTLRYELGSGDIARWNLSLPAIFALLAAAILFILLLALAGIVLGNLARGALIGMVDEVETTGTTTARSGWRIGWARWLRLFAIGLVIGIPAFLVILVSLAIVAAPILLAVGGATLGVTAGEGLAIIAILLVIGLFLLWLLFVILLSAALSILSEMAYRKCVLEGQGVFASIGAGYRLARRHLREAGLTWLILWGIDLAVSIVMIPLVLLAFAIIALPAGLTWIGTHNVPATLVVGGTLVLLMIAALAFAGGVFTAFRSSVWTLTYREIAARERAAAAQQTTL